MATSLLGPPAGVTNYTAFAPGSRRPEGTLLENAAAAAAAVFSADKFAPRAFSLPGAENEMKRVEAALAAGDAEAALKRARAIRMEDLPDEMQSRLYFFMAQCAISLAKLGQAERWFDAAATALERCYGFEEPSRIPCLLNRGCTLVRLGRFREACDVLRKARAVCDSLLSAPQQIRIRVLLALAAAVLGSGDMAAAEAAYRDALDAAEAEERLASSGGGGGGARRRPQPSRAVLAALLQSRGEHAEACRLLSVQRAALREAVRRGEGSEAELAHTCGRLAVSAFALRKDTAATGALRAAARFRVSHGTLYTSSGGPAQGRVKHWLEHEQDPHALAAAAKARAAPREVMKPPNPSAVVAQ